MVWGGHCLLTIKSFRKVQYTTKKMQVGINKVERWRIKWGFKFPSETSKGYVSYRKGD